MRWPWRRRPKPEPTRVLSPLELTVVRETIRIGEKIRAHAVDLLEEDPDHPDAPALRLEVARADVELERLYSTPGAPPRPADSTP